MDPMARFIAALVELKAQALVLLGCIDGSHPISEEAHLQPQP